MAKERAGECILSGGRASDLVLRLRGITCTAHTPRAHRARTACWNYGGKVIPWFLGDSMLTYCPYSEVEMTLAGTRLPFYRV